MKYTFTDGRSWQFVRECEAAPDREVYVDSKCWNADDPLKVLRPFAGALPYVPHTVRLKDGIKALPGEIVGVLMPNDGVGI